MDDNYFREISSQCLTKVELHKKLDIPYNGTGGRIINEKIKKTNALLKQRVLKWEKIEKKCPVCNKKFSTKKNHKREQIVCSRGCSNTYFRSGENNSNWKESVYRTTCFLYHGKKCVCCDEKIIVAVHHYDGNKKNNKPENLIPLCPNHHHYFHSKYKYMIEDKIIEYRNNFINKK